MILILPITKVFDKIFACNLVCGLELAFPYFFCQTSLDNCMFLRYFSQKSIFAFSLCILSMIVNIAKMSWARLHNDVLVTSYEDGWFWYQWKEETHSYNCIGSKCNGIGR